MLIKTGSIFEAKDQPPLIVVRGNELPPPHSPDSCGPWIRWRFPWEEDKDAQDTIIYAFEELISKGKYELKQAGPPAERSK